MLATLSVHRHELGYQTGPEGMLISGGTPTQV